MKSHPGLPGDDNNEGKFIEMNERERSREHRDNPAYGVLPAW